MVFKSVVAQGGRRPPLLVLVEQEVCSGGSFALVDVCDDVYRCRHFRVLSFSRRPVSDSWCYPASERLNSRLPSPAVCVSACVRVRACVCCHFPPRVWWVGRRLHFFVVTEYA